MSLSSNRITYAVAYSFGQTLQPCRHPPLVNSRACGTVILIAWRWLQVERGSFCWGGHKSLQVAAFTFLALLALATKTLRDTKGQMLMLASSCTLSCVSVAVQRLTVMVNFINVRLWHQQCRQKETDRVSSRLLHSSYSSQGKSLWNRKTPMLYHYILSNVIDMEKYSSSLQDKPNVFQSISYACFEVLWCWAMKYGSTKIHLGFLSVKVCCCFVVVWQETN